MSAEAPIELAATISLLSASTSKGLSHHPDRLTELTPTPQTLRVLLDDAHCASDIKRRAFTDALLRAASNGDADLIEWLLDERGDAKRWVILEAMDNDGVPAIVLATCFGHGDAVRALVEAGADVDATDSGARVCVLVSPARTLFWADHSHSWMDGVALGNQER
jgi:Ankyrin repeats (3 copies)